MRRDFAHDSRKEIIVASERAAERLGDENENREQPQSRSAPVWQIKSHIGCLSEV
jgi:hypothetical protein